MSVEYDSRSPEYQADPYPVLRRLQAEEPVHIHVEGDERFWILTRHEDCESVLKDGRFTAAKFGEDMMREVAEQPDSPLAAMARATLGMMLLKDPPDHTRLRGLVNKAFTPRVVEQLRPRVQGVADELIEAVEANGAMDLVSDFAEPLPVIVIAELLGVPVEDRVRLKRWSDAFVTFIDGTIRDQGLVAASQAAGELREYLGQIVAQRRARPRDDLITRLAQAQEADDRLDDDELFSTVVLLLAAGHETTTNLIGNAMHELMQRRDQLEMLRARPELTRDALEELLRYAPPVMVTSRRPLEDVVIRGHEIPKGEEINLSLAAANRDPAVFDEPERLDIQRGDSRHLSFGLGVHFCLGASLARLEGQTAVATLLKRLPAIRHATPLQQEPLRYKPGVVLRGPLSLAVRF